MEGEIVSCSFSDFLRNYISFATEDAVVDVILKMLLPPKELEPDEDKNLSKNHSNIVTKADEMPNDSYYFLRGEMSSQYNEIRYFEPLVEITKAIEDTMGRKPNYGYHHSPNCRIEGKSGSNDRCDAFFKSGDPTPIQTRNIAVACQLKKDSEWTYDNNSKLVSANVRIMNDDVRRRFAFGITIEGAFMRLWYFSRSHSAVTEDEDYVKNPSSLIKVFASFMYATSEDIGYDPQISIYREPTGGINYTYTIAAKDTGETSYYRTVSSIYEIRPNRATSRMVRIWKAVKVDTDRSATPTNETYCVLKDVWLDCDAKTEQEIQQDLFADIEKFLDTPRDDDKTFEKFRQSLLEIRDMYRDYFLTIVAGSKGEPGKGVVFPHSRTTGLLESPLDLASVPAVSSGCRESQRGVPPPSGTPIPTNEARNIRAKMRCFSVVNEVCSAADDLPTLGDVVDIVEQTLTPLELMCGAGWVHRDISSGNILAHKDASGKWKVKLSDLEYAKRFSALENAQAHADPKTGTAFFMPHEVLNGRYEHDDKSKARKASVMAALYKKPLITPPSAPRTRGKDPVFHSFAHDLESLYWFLLWIITCRIEFSDPENVFNTKVFSDEHLLTPQRTNAFRLEITEDLSSILPLALKTKFPENVDSLRETVCSACEFVRATHSVDKPSEYMGMYDFFRVYLQPLNEPGPWREVKLIKRKAHQPGARPLQSRKGKRKASATEDDDDYQDEAPSHKNSRLNDLHPTKRKRLPHRPA